LKGEIIEKFPSEASSGSNLRSIILMIAAMGCFTFADLLIKIASQVLPVGQVMIVLGVGSALVFWTLMRLQGEAIRLSPLVNPAILIRNFGEIIAATSMCLALVYVPISTIGAVIQTVPLMITAVAALFLGERVGARRAMAILVGFLGAILIVQPNEADFDAKILLVFASAVGMTIRDVATKLVSHNFSTLLLSFYSCVLFSLSGCVLLLMTKGAGMPDLKMMITFLAMIALGSLGVIFMTKAVRLGDMSVVSPFRYTRLLFSVAAGVLILGEQVTGMMLFGSALTIGAGLYIWRREILVRDC
jgi:drug/metabolite transporter (DMT)-like permease